MCDSYEWQSNLRNQAASLGPILSPHWGNLDPNFLGLGPAPSL